MSKPNPAIVEAIIDSYLTIRNSLWKLVNEDCSEVTVPENEKARVKALTAAKCISDAKKCKTTADWVDYIARIHEIELAEMKEGNDKWFLVKWVTDIPLLGHTLTAVRAYILDQIKDEKYQTSINAHLGNVDTFKSNVDYHKQYFLDITRKRDHRGLNEKSFDEFALNVSCDKREAVIAKLLLSKQKKPDAELEAQRTGEAAAAAEKSKQAKIKEDEIKARLGAERAAAEEARRAAVAEKAKREDEERRAAARARQLEEERRAMEKARHEEENKRMAAELQHIHDEEERAAKAKAQNNSASTTALANAPADTSKSVRARRKSVNFDPTLFSQSSRPLDPMEIDYNHYSSSSSSTPGRRSSHSSRNRSNG